MTFEVGQRVGRYVIRGRLGSGAMGMVFRAEDTELGREVALKILHPNDSGDADARARLIREARAAAQLSHPNVVVVHEVGEHAGAPFLAMELVDGVTLRAWLADGDRDWREIVRVIGQAGRGLAAAHGRGLVHRDFKPDNVLVDRTGRARVADFGLARAGEALPGEAATLPLGSPIQDTPRVDPRLARMTATGSLAGTPAYMAPELVDGAPPDARSDQFAFAVVLHEALHGQHPFEGNTAKQLWLEMAADRVRDSGRDVPAWLELAVRRGLFADPARRWPDVASFVDAIEAEPAGAAAPAGKASWIAVGVAAAAIAIVGAAVALTHGGAHSAAGIDDGSAAADDDDDGPFQQRDGVGERLACDAPSIAAWPKQRAKVEQALAADPARARTVVAALDKFAGDWTAAVRAACESDRADAALGCLARARIRGAAAMYGVQGLGKPGAPAIVEALPALDCAAGPPLPKERDAREAAEKAVRDLAQGTIGRDAGSFVFAMRTTDHAATSADHGGEPGIAVRARILGAEMCRLVDNPKCSARDTTEALAGARATGDAQLIYEAQLAAQVDAPADDAPLAPFAGPLPPLEAARLRTLLGDAQLATAHHLEGAGKGAEALARARDAEASYRAAYASLPAAHHLRAIADAKAGAAMVAEHRAADARPLLADALARLDRTCAPERPESVAALRALTAAEIAAGHLPRAAELHADLLARRAKILHPHDSRLADDEREYAAMLGKAGHHAEAVTALEAMVAVLEQNNDRVATANGRVDLANEQLSAEQYDAVELGIAQALPVLVRERGADNMDVAAAEYALIRARVERVPPQKLPETAVLLDHVQKVFAKSFGENSQGMVAVLEARSQLASAKRDYAGAERALTLALGLLGDAGSDLDYRGEIAFMRAQALWQLGRREEARANAEASVKDYEAAGPAFAEQLAKSRAWLADPK